MQLQCYSEVERLTKALVNIKSVNKEPEGESAAARYVYDYYMALPYFKEHPEYAKCFQTKNDFVERHSTYAFVKGTKNGGSHRTVLMIGHIDTVGIDDYGAIKEYACDPDRLPEILKTVELPPEVLKDIDSGEYMFGRGALDMKAGVAGHMYLIAYFSQHPEELEGNILAVAECDEEDNSKGILTAIDELVELRQSEGFQYVACVNADYSTNYNPGDESRYIYYGSIGKLLPCYAVFGKEAHVGQAFSAFDPNLLTAEITRDISYNTDLCDEKLGEVTIPPVSLKQTDTKPNYTVQTALVSFSYYNFFTHGMNPAQVLEKCKGIAETAFDTVIQRLGERYRSYCEKSHVGYTPLPWHRRVYLWKEFYDELAQQHGQKFKDAMEAFRRKLQEEDPAMDLRMFSLRVAEEAWKWSTDKNPAVVIFFGSIYNARIEVSGKNGKEHALLDSVEKAVEAVRPEAGRQLKTRMFYPYISDSSFLAVCDDLSTIKALGDNMPSWKVKYYHDTDKILQIDVPVVNIGTFGRDGHMFTERVDKKHTFENVPNITYLTVRGLIG
ncbi:MAG: M20/M25/M40 family metallo-hydrolase [Clostridiaceae bacterium]|nr:M20/M25/M40 family metallo-hydrolase [Clostridiaceae bacterium]